jgi:MEDS: MEthanogen/methylotroph, DcmR Sensory domain
MDFSSFRQVPSQVPTVVCAEHIVQFWSDDEVLLDRLEGSISSAIEAGDAAICIATKIHTEGLAKRFKLHGDDMTAAIEQGRYVTLDAAQTLSAVMPQGKFEQGRFFEFFRKVLVKARNAIEHKGSHVTVFGEAVALLWSRGNHDDAIRWERSGNVLAQGTAVSVCCGYAIRAFDLQRDNDYFQMICAEHSAVILPAGLPALSDKDRQEHIESELKQVLLQAEQLGKRDTILLYPEWQGPYRAALLETDRKQLFKEVEVAESAVLARLQVLPTQTENLPERHQLIHAWSGVQMIKKKKLGFLQGTGSVFPIMG